MTFWSTLTLGMRGLGNSIPINMSLSIFPECVQNAPDSLVGMH
jgi:hypothetical protein